MKADIEPIAAEWLRAFYETAVKQAEETAEAFFEGAEKLAETLAPLIEGATKALAELLPLLIEEVRRRAVYRPTKKDAPRKLGAVTENRKQAWRRPCARSQI